VEKAAGCLSDTQRARGSQKGELAALRIGELRLCVGGLVVSGSVTRRRKRYGSGGDGKFEVKLTKFERISPGRVCFFLLREQKGESESIDENTVVP